MLSVPGIRGPCRGVMRIKLVHPDYTNWKMMKSTCLLQGGGK